MPKLTTGIRILSFRPVMCLIASSAALSIGVTRMLAQAPPSYNKLDETSWSKINQQDSRFTNCTIVWKMVLVTSPRPKLDVEKSAAISFDEIPKRKMSDIQLESVRMGSISMATLKRDGYEIHQTLTFQRSPGLIRCDVVSSSPAPINRQRKPLPSARYTDIYDGTNAISMSGVGEDIPNRATLVRDSRQVMMHSAADFGEPILLAGSPISTYFQPNETEVQQDQLGAVTLEKRWKEGAISKLGRLKLSSTTSRPISLQIINPVNNAVHSKYTVSEYKQYPGGIWFPSAIRKVRTTETGAIIDETKYSLVSATFTRPQGATKSTIVLPKGTLMADFRFGSQVKAQSYRFGDRLPSDDEYHAFLAKAQVDMSATRTKQRKERLLSALVVGSVLSGLAGVIMVIRMRKRASIMR